MNYTRPLGFLIIVLCTAFTSCEEKSQPNKQSDIYKIVFAQGGCHGACPAESFSIDSALNIQYRGVEYVDRIGYFQGDISDFDWDTIQALCRKCRGLQSDSCIGALDAQGMELHIYDKAGVLHFRGDHECLPAAVVALCTYLDTLENNTLMAESYPFPLETSVHLPPPRIDTPISTEPE